MRLIVSNDIQLLTGVGIEVLVDIHYNVLIEFFNGFIMTGMPVGNTDDTIILIAA